MCEMNEIEIGKCSGAMIWEGNRMSDNVIDNRGYFSRSGSTGEILWGETFSRYFW